MRELREECGVKAEAKELKKAAECLFLFPSVPEDQNWNQNMHVFLLSKWEGTPTETEEMKPVQMEAEKLPFEQMWEADQHWIPEVLKGKQIKAKFVYNEQQQHQRYLLHIFFSNSEGRESNPLTRLSALSAFSLWKDGRLSLFGKEKGFVLQAGAWPFCHPRATIP